MFRNQILVMLQSQIRASTCTHHVAMPSCLKMGRKVHFSPTISHISMNHALGNHIAEFIINFLSLRNPSSSHQLAKTTLVLSCSQKNSFSSFFKICQKTLKEQSLALLDSSSKQHWEPISTIIPQLEGHFADCFCKASSMAKFGWSHTKLFRTKLTSSSNLRELKEHLFHFNMAK